MRAGMQENVSQVLQAEPGKSPTWAFVPASMVCIPQGRFQPTDSLITNSQILLKTEQSACTLVRASSSTLLYHMPHTTPAPLPATQPQNPQAALAWREPALSKGLKAAATRLSVSLTPPAQSSSLSLPDTDPSLELSHFNWVHRKHSPRVASV